MNVIFTIGISEYLEMLNTLKIHVDNLTKNEYGILTLVIGIAKYTITDTHKYHKFNKNRIHYLELKINFTFITGIFENPNIDTYVDYYYEYDINFEFKKF